MGCTSSKEASRLESGAASSAAVFLSVQEDARVAANPVAQANKGTTTSVQNRLTLGEEFANCANIGNPNMSRKNAVVISAADLKAWGRMPLYEECAERGQHVPIERLALTDKVAFISHRWQDALKNLADDAAGSQYRVIMAYLLGSEEGRSVAYVWLDLACINQDRSHPESLLEFFVKLDNIGTAIACSHTVLVVPRLIKQQRLWGQPLYLSDLEEYTKRGWCLLEILSAIEMRRLIRVALVCGAPAEARFELVQPGPAPGEELTLAKLVEEGNAQRQSTDDDGARASNSLRAAVGRALEALRSPGAAPAAAGALLDWAAECWGGAEDPAALLRKMHGALDADLNEEEEDWGVRSTVANQQRTAATLTVDPNSRETWEPQAGKAIAALLPRFTKEEDREVVVRLLACLLMLARTAFAAVVPRDPEALRALVLNRLDLDHANGPTLHLRAKDLLPCEVGLMVEALVGELARREAAGEGLAGRPLRLDLTWNPIGPHGVKALREAAPRLPPLRTLNLWECGLGAGGALELAELLATPSPGGATVGAHLHELVLERNGLGEAGGWAVAEALPSVPELKELDLGSNGLGAVGGRVVATALASVPKLETLDLTRTGLGEAGGRAVAAALPSVPKLKELDLGSNGLGEASGRAVAAALPSVPELETLDLTRNGLGEASGRAVAAALPSVPKLEALKLGNNDLGAAGGRAVAEALASVPELKVLDLGNNGLGEAGGRAVTAALPSVPKLEYLYLGGNGLGEAAEAAVRAAWAVPLPDGGYRDESRLKLW